MSTRSSIVAMGVAFALVSGALAASLTAAQRNPSPVTRTNLNGIHVFHPGSAHHIAAERIAVPVGARLPGVEFSRTLKPQSLGASSKFTLTPQAPYLEGQGYLEANQTPGWDAGNNLIFIGHNPSLQDVNVVVNATMGTTYLIDVSVAPSSPVTGCQFVVYGPDGQQSIYPCSATSGVVQHLVFAYEATVSGEAWFSVTTANPSGGFFYAATIAQL